jgi:hypothetical protein
MGLLPEQQQRRSLPLLLQCLRRCRGSDRLIYLSAIIHPFISPSIHLTFFLFIYPSIHLTFYPSPLLSIYISIHSSHLLSISPSFYLYIHPFISPSIHLPFYLSHHSPSIYPISPSIYPISPSFYPIIHLLSIPSFAFFLFHHSPSLYPSIVWMSPQINYSLKYPLVE